MLSRVDRSRAAIELQALVKRYGEIVAVAGLDLSVLEARLID